MGTIQIKRIYEPAEKKDGKRILVDRLWPRGLKKESAYLDEWMMAVAPSVALRKWFGHDPAKWETFSLQYTLELKQNKAVNDLIELVKHTGAVTLLYAAHDEQHNHALVLQRFLTEIFKK
jgi:uncharacterized protein YeaO (DUF488 family)